MVVSVSILILLPLISWPAYAQTTCTVYCPDGSTPNVPCDADWDVCATDSSSGYEQPAYDYGAAQRALDEELERQRQAELARQRQEQLDNQRLETEQRKQQEEAERQAKLNRDREALANSLKGTSGTDTQLKSSTRADPPLTGNNVPNLTGSIPAVSSTKQAEIKRLQAKEQELNLGIERDIKAINNLGFSRRAEDFAEWDKLATDAKAGFENEVKDAVTDAIVAKAQDKLLQGFGGIDKYKADGWIKQLEKLDPPPVEVIAALRRLGGAQDKAKMIEDANLILANIDRIQKLISSDDLNAAMADVSQDILCGMAPPPLNDQCSLLKTETKLTIAALYNNAVRRVAVNEVNRLTEMTEEQLKALQKLNDVLKKHTQDRNLLRQQISRLQKN